MLQQLNFPNADLKLTRLNGQIYVWCIIRKKKLVLTPEEWVRQHVIHFLITDKQIPLALIATEMAITVNDLSRRCDIVVFGNNGSPRMIVECKAPEIPLTEKVFHQIAQYNFKLNVDWLILTNGLQNITCLIDRIENKLNYTTEIPTWNMIK